MRVQPADQAQHLLGDFGNGKIGVVDQMVFNGRLLQHLRGVVEGSEELARVTGAFPQADPRMDHIEWSRWQLLRTPARVAGVQRDGVDAWLPTLRPV